MDEIVEGGGRKRRNSLNLVEKLDLHKTREIAKDESKFLYKLLHVVDHICNDHLHIYPF